MKTALITTTINVPTVLALYRKLGPDVMMFVAGDENTPVANTLGRENAVQQVLGLSDPNWAYYSPEGQRELGYSCSELLGFNNDSRRNIALLEAVKWGADVIFSCDDDMIPLGLDFFERFEIMLSEPYAGLQLGAADQWVDVGKFTIPPFSQRGLPHGKIASRAFSAAHEVNIGVMQGIILGTPDTNGHTMACNPVVHSATDILRNGFVVEPRAKSVFNSQITAFRRELAPCFAQFYKWQFRNTDILASLVMRRVMRERNLYTYFGPPTGFHARSERDPRKDISAEEYGVGIIEKFQGVLDATILPPGTVVQQTRHLYTALAASDCFPALEVAFAFLDDMEKVL